MKVLQKVSQSLFENFSPSNYIKTLPFNKIRFVCIEGFEPVLVTK